MAFDEPHYAASCQPTPEVQEARQRQAVVTLGGRDFYLGPWKSASSKTEYDRLTREFLASGGLLVHDARDELTVVELLAAFKLHAATYYIDPTTRETTCEYHNYATLLDRLSKFCGRTFAGEYGPLRLRGCHHPRPPRQVRLRAD